MTFTSKLAAKKLLVGGIAAVALSLSAGASATVSAQSDSAHPGTQHCMQQHPSNCHNNPGQNHHPGQGQGNGNGNGHGGGHGYGGTNVKVEQNVFVTISNAVGSAVNVTINFVTNIFS